MIIITDGSYRSSKDQGGIGVVWVKDDKIIKTYSRGFKGTTNNIMELTAIYVAIKSIKKPIDSLEIVSDSEYSLGVIFNPKWKPKKNIELITKIKETLVECQKLVKSSITYTHIKGHGKSDSEYSKYNDIADKLATNASLELL